jgi:hypothetical protein
VYVHSLEGCVGQGFLGRLRSFHWTEVTSPPPRTWQAQLLRRALRGVLWASAHPWRVEDYDANNLARFPAAAASVTNVNLLQVLGGHKR